MEAELLKEMSNNGQKKKPPAPPQPSSPARTEYTEYTEETYVSANQSTCESPRKKSKKIRTKVVVNGKLGGSASSVASMPTGRSSGASVSGDRSIRTTRTTRSSGKRKNPSTKNAGLDDE
jgi:hypothetical protein